MILKDSFSPSLKEALELFMREVSLQKKTSLELSNVSLEQASELAHNLALFLAHPQKHTLVLLQGQLGAGKTTFSQSFVTSWLQREESVESPTYAYVIPYPKENGLLLFHFDLYRLRSSDEYVALGFDEYWRKPGLSLIEWPERIEDLLEGQERLILTIRYGTSLDSRHWSLTYYPAS